MEWMSEPINRQFCAGDVLIIGGGPAGLAAACCASLSGRQVIVLDDNPGLGGQIWRSERKNGGNPQAAIWLDRAQRANIRFICGARVFDAPQTGLLMAETSDSIYQLGYERLILATGARERFLPFPGWTLPNVMGAGGLQALVKSGLPISGKRVVVAGSGPLLLAVAAYLRKCGADIKLIAEQAPLRRLLGFSLELLKQPGKAFQAMGLRKQLLGVPYLTDCWPVAAQGDEKLSVVRLRRGERSWQVQCDYLACGFHLLPNIELALLLGCEAQDGAVRVDDFQQTSIPGVYCAGEATGIGGVELSLVEGQIAGYAAVERHDEARHLFAARERHRRFADALNRAFALRYELKQLPDPGTIVCRCEDITFASLREQNSWRAAKLQTRCGMGPCQGRICGAALEFLLGWKVESVRPPVFPATLEGLAQAAGAPADKERSFRESPTD